MSDSLVSPELGDTRALSPGKFRFLRYWSLNITLARSMGQSEFPGFSYGDDEWTRMEVLSTGLTTAGIWLWLGVVVLSYLIAAAVAVGGVLGTALSLLWRGHPAPPESQFFAVIALIIVVLIGVGMPFSIAFGGLVADPLWRNKPAEAPGDFALHAKVSRQFRNMGLVTGGLVLVIALLWGFVLR
jgi:hypothetical protein